MFEEVENVWFDAKEFLPPIGAAVLCRRKDGDKYGPLVVACRIDGGKYQRLNDTETFSGVEHWMAPSSVNPDPVGRAYYLTQVLNATGRPQPPFPGYLEAVMIYGTEEMKKILRND